MCRHEVKHRRIPPLQHFPLEIQVLQFTAREDTSRIARLTDGGSHERREVPTAAQHVLDAQSASHSKALRPLCVDLALEIECSPFVGEVTGGEEENEDNPEEESVNGEEGTIVEEESGPPDETGEDSETTGKGGHDKFGTVPNANNIRSFQNVEPN